MKIIFKNIIYKLKKLIKLKKSLKFLRKTIKKRKKNYRYK